MKPEAASSEIDDLPFHFRLDGREIKSTFSTGRLGLGEEEKLLTLAEIWEGKTYWISLSSIRDGVEKNRFGRGNGERETVDDDAARNVYSGGRLCWTPREKKDLYIIKKSTTRIE